MPRRVKPPLEPFPTHQRLDAIARLVVDDTRAAPAAGVAAARVDGDRVLAAVGSAGTVDGRPATPHTVFDLASITKPYTALTALRLHRRGRLSLEDPLERWLDEAKGTPLGRASLEHHLAHRAGAAAHRTLWEPLLRDEQVDRAEALREAARALREDCADVPGQDGHPPLYSDLGYLLVGEALARAVGRSLAELVEEEVAIPAESAVVPAERLHGEVAPTEDVPFRRGVVRGEVHDENAWAMSGRGLSGHAGLFGTAEAVLRLGIALLQVLAGKRGTWLRPADLGRLVRPRPGGTLRAGFDGKAKEASSAGVRFGVNTFGHLGFTGTSLWIDPDVGAVAVLLTNRVHPSRAADGIRRARPMVHDALWEWATDPAPRR
jgi:serine-type D-Ala-D-Ala carboxypeptidase